MAPDATHGGRVVVVVGRSSRSFGIQDRPDSIRSTVARGRYTASVQVRAARAGSRGEPLTIVLRERAGSRVVARRTSTRRLGRTFRPLKVALTARGSGHRIDVRVLQGHAERGDAFLADSLRVARARARSSRSGLGSAGSPVSPGTPTPAPPPAMTPGRARYATPSTLPAILGSAQAGDRVLLRSGSYPAFVTISRSGTAGAPITISAAPGESPVVTGRFEVTGRHIAITRLVFRGRTAANPDDSLIYVNGGSDIEISYNELSGSALSAIGVWDRPGDRVRIVRNWIHDVGADQWSHGVYYAKGSDGLIAGNRIERIAGHGIQAYPNPQRLTIAGNEIADAGRDGKACLIVSSDAQGGLPLAAGVVVEGNYAHGCPVYGFRTDWQNPLSGPYGAGNAFRANWAHGNGAGDFGDGAPLGSTPSTTGATWSGNVVGAPPGGVLVPTSAVGPAGR